MQGSLAFAAGVVWLGRHGRRAEIRVFDLDGRELPGGFVVAPRTPHRRSTAAGIAVSEARRLWIADEAAGEVRTFNPFGAEGPAFVGAGAEDRAGRLGRPADVCLDLDGHERFDGPTLLAAARGTRRHAVQRFALDGSWLESLRPLGDPDGTFGDVSGVAAHGRFVWVSEEGAGRVQVFRDGEFHYALVAGTGTTPHAFRPRAVAPLADGGFVVASGGSPSALLSFDASGHFERLLADHGTAPGALFEPGDVIAVEATGDEQPRLLVVDCDGDRVQVFNLAGRCYGAFRGLPRTDD